MVHFNVNGAGFKGAQVPAIEAGFAGFYVGDKPYKPDPAAIRATLPHRWRKAFDRAGPMWWPRDRSALAYVELRDARGRYLTTVYANGNA